MAAAVGELAARLTRAARVTILTGAGVSAASGVPTFRGSDGLWRRFRPEELATPGAFSRDPRLVWEWYDWRRQRIAACPPNPAHVTIARWSRALPAFTLITQNVDGLHERAGTDHVLRYHGSIWELKCWTGCGTPGWRNEQTPLPSLPPACPSCGGLARPGVVWFGEAIPRDVAAKADEATRCDLFVVVGTSAVVYPAAGLVDVAAARGAFTVEVNAEATGASDRVDLSLRGAAEAILPDVDRLLESLS